MLCLIQPGHLNGELHCDTHGVWWDSARGRGCPVAGPERDQLRAKRIIGRLWPLRAELRGLWQSYAELSEAYTDVYADRGRAIRERADANRRAGQRLTEIKQLKAAPHGYVTQEVAQGLRTDLAEARAEVGHQIRLHQELTARLAKEAK